MLICWVKTDSFEVFEAALDTDDSIVAQSVLESTSEKRLYHLRLAEEIGISPPSLSARLRRAECQVIENALSTNGDVHKETH